MKNQRWRCTWIRELWISANSQSLDRFDNRLMNRSMTNTTNACTTDLLESIILPSPNGHSIRWERCIEERREEERGVCRVVEETNQTKCNWKIEPCFPSTSICCCSFFSYIFSIRFIWLSELFYLRNAVQCVNTEYKQCGRCSCFSFILHLRFFFSSASFHTERSLTSFALCRTRSQYVSFRTTTRIQCAIYFSFFFRSWSDVEWWLLPRTHAAWNDFTIHLFRWLQYSHVWVCLSVVVYSILKAMLCGSVLCVWKKKRIELNRRKKKSKLTVVRWEQWPARPKTRAQNRFGCQKRNERRIQNENKMHDRQLESTATFSCVAALRVWRDHDHFCSFHSAIFRVFGIFEFSTRKWTRAEKCAFVADSKSPQIEIKFKM